MFRVTRFWQGTALGFTLGAAATFGALAWLNRAPLPEDAKGPAPDAVQAVGATWMAQDRFHAPVWQSGYRAFRVPAGGMMLYEVARQTLGDGRRWPEIYKMNPQVNPEFVLPAGTELRLPPGAGDEPGEARQVVRPAGAGTSPERGRPEERKGQVFSFYQGSNP